MVRVSRVRVRVLLELVALVLELVELVLELELELNFYLFRRAATPRFR